MSSKILFSSRNLGSRAVSTARRDKEKCWEQTIPWDRRTSLKRQEFSFPRLMVVPALSSHEVDGVRKEKERLTAAARKESEAAVTFLFLSHVCQIRWYARFLLPG